MSVITARDVGTAWPRRAGGGRLPHSARRGWWSWR